MEYKKRFSPYRIYKMNGKIRYTSVGPDGERKDSLTWCDDRIKEIRYIFLQKNRDNKFQLKPYQKKIMTSILSGKDTFAILPTGSGKSLCFQAPSIFFPGITLVITPLVALIEDQVEHFNKNAYPYYHPYAKNYYEGIRFKAIYPGMDGLSDQAMFSEIQNPRKDSGTGREIQYKFLYAAPERLNNPKFARLLKRAEEDGLQISHVVVDEAHCMSQWGFDFRESYLHIAQFIAQRPIRPIISAFTATATPRDIAEIKNLLRFPVDRAEKEEHSMEEKRSMEEKHSMEEEPYEDKKYEEIFRLLKRKNLSLHVLPCSDWGNGEEPVPRDAGHQDIAPQDAGRQETGSEGTQDAPRKTRLDTLFGILEKNLSRVCIIYRTTASGVDELYRTLRENELLRDRIVKYHAQMSETAKRRNRSLFERSHDETIEKERQSDAQPSGKPCRNIMIATKAFGMGIDKKDISLVIHYDMPRSLEDYYQEVGRAGRDAEKVPEAHCYLLYSVGPKKEKGTLQYTINWVTDSRNARKSGCMPIASRFSDEMKESIYFWSYYRLCYMMRYCNLVKENPGRAHGFIIGYLSDSLADSRSLKKAADSLDFFYDYIVHHYPVPPEEREHFLEEYLFRGTDIVRFAGGCPEQGQKEKGVVDRCHVEIRRLTDEVNELHINNTNLAGFLRHHPDEYQPDVPCDPLKDAPGSGQEWRSAQNKSVKGAESKSLRPSDIRQDAAFLFVSDHQACEGYVNAAWDMRRDKSPAADVMFTVDYHHVIKGVLKRQGDRWRLLTQSEDLQPYRRYLGCHIKGLFLKKRYSEWRKTKKSSKNPESPEGIQDADSLFAYAPGIRPHRLIFTIHGRERLSYFDLCVLDAIYSIEAAQKENITVEAIWDLLTGRSPSYSSQEKKRFRKDIQDSINKMRTMSLSVSDNQCGYEAKEAPFLPLTEKPRKGYSWTEIPPLFLYAEEMNGQIIKVPVSLFDVRRIQESALWKDDFRAEFRQGMPEGYSLDGNKKHAFGSRVQSLPLDAVDEKKARELLSPKDCRRLDKVRGRTYSFSPSIENTLLCHYLVHRISISRKVKRGNFILFSTIKEVTGNSEDSCLFQKKAAALMEHYSQIGYVKGYYLYITNYDYGDDLKDTAYFRAKAGSVIKYWQLDGTGHMFLSDFDAVWSWRYNKRLSDDNSNFTIKTDLVDALCRDGRSLSAETERSLALVPLGGMDGIVLQHEP